MKTVVSGDSWANRNYTSRMHPSFSRDYKKWDEYLAEYYGWDVINPSGDALGNGEIIKRAIDLIHKNDVERCFISLSQWYRFSTIGDNRFNPNSQFISIRKPIWDDDVTQEQKDKHEKWINFQQGYFNLIPFNKKLKLALIEESLFQIYHIIDVCSYKNIELNIFQCIPSGISQEDSDIMEIAKQNPYYKMIEERKNEAKLWDWPFCSEWGALDCIANQLIDRYPNYVISEQDNHPSEKGHYELFKVIRDNYEYNNSFWV